MTEGSLRRDDEAIEQLMSMLSEALRSSGTKRADILDRVQRDLATLIRQAEGNQPDGLAERLQTRPDVAYYVFERQSSYHTILRKDYAAGSHNRVSPPPEAETLDFDGLTDREREIIAHLAKGAANKEIARALNITDATVKVHIRTILRKLGLKNRTQAALCAMQRVWLRQD